MDFLRNTLEQFQKEFLTWIFETYTLLHIDVYMIDHKSSTYDHKDACYCQALSISQSVFISER